MASAARPAAAVFPGKYLPGKDGWIFLDQDTNRVVAQMTGRHLLGEADLDRWAAIAAHRRDRLARRGIHFYFLVAPNKKAIYPEHLPDGIRISPVRPVFQVKERIEGGLGLPVIYPDRELVAAKPLGFVYPKTDTHWSGMGGHVAYRVMAARMAADGVPLHVVEPSEFSFAETEIVGDLGVKLTPNVTSVTLSTRLRAPRSRMVHDNRITNRGRTRVFENEDRSLPKCVLFGDSFGGNLIAFLRESFSTFVYIYGNVIDEEVLDQFRPDVVVTEMVERFLINPPDEFGSIRNVEIVRRKIESLPEAELPGIEEAFRGAASDGRPHARFQLGVLYSRQKRYAEAEEALRGAVAEDPGNAHLRHLLANAIAERQGSLDEAVRHIEQAVRLDGGKAEHHHLRGLIELRRGRPAAAEAALARAIALNPSVPWWRYQLAQSLFRQGKWARAREVLDGFIALSPASADAFQLLGRLCTELGEDAAAAEAFRRCAALKPDWAWPHLKLAQLLLRAGADLPEAEAAIDRTAALAGSDRERSEAYLLKAQILLAQGRRDEARLAVDQCLGIRPDWDWARSLRERIPAEAGSQRG